MSEERKGARGGRKAVKAPRLFPRTLVWTAVLLLLLCFPGVTGLGETRSPVLCLSPLPAFAQTQAEQAGSGVYDDAWLRGLESRVQALLSPVYGKAHVVVQASFAEPRTQPQGRPPVSVAIIIDTSVLGALPTHPEGLRAEQERLGGLVSHAVGLRGDRGDAVAISFLLFTERERSALLWKLGLGGLVLLLAAGLSLLLRRGTRRQRTDVRAAFRVGGMTGGRGPAKAHSRLAERLSSERPQARAVALALLAPEDAALVLSAWKTPAQAETLACMALQGPVEQDVVDLIATEFCRDFPVRELSFETGGDAAGCAAAVIRSLEDPVRRRVLAQLERAQPRAWERLADRLD